MNKLFLYLSSYVPLYLILIIKNTILKIENMNCSIKNIQYFNSLDDFVLIILMLLTIVSLVCIKKSLRDIEKYQSNKYKIVRINNALSNNILNYISIYILTFIDFNLNSYSNIATLVFIIILLGIISIKYDDLYINPTLLLWNYKIYNVNIEKNGVEIEKIILIKGNLYKNININIYESNKQYTFAKKIEN